MRFAFIHDHATAHRVTTLCRVLRVSKAGYYAWVHRPPSARAVADIQLAAVVRMVHRTSRRTYGSPRIHAELQAQGERHSAKRIARLMRTHGIRAKTRRRFRVTTDSHHPYPIAPNQLARTFGVAQVAAPNRVWVGDITYLTTREGWLYLAVVLDLASRRACSITRIGAVSTRPVSIARSSPRTGCAVA
jgi:putative transposase